MLRPLELANADQVQAEVHGARVPKAIANAASRRISEKQGMRVIATIERD